MFERAGGNALIVRVAQDPLIEYNYFNQNGIKCSGNAAFNYNTDGAVWQYNESCFTKKNVGDADAGGLDSDFRSKNTIIQYNYLVVPYKGIFAHNLFIVEKMNAKFGIGNKSKNKQKTFALSFCIIFFKFHAVAAISALICIPFSPDK